MRFLSCRVACGLARASSGSANAVVALSSHLSKSAGYMPCSRHHALLPASSSAAAVMTASSRAPVVQTRPRAGLDYASTRHHSNVCTDTPISFATTPTWALSGGNNRATVLFLQSWGSPWGSALLEALGGCCQTIMNNIPRLLHGENLEEMRFSEADSEGTKKTVKLFAGHFHCGAPFIIVVRDWPRRIRARGGAVRAWRRRDVRAHTLRDCLRSDQGDRRN